MSALRSYSPGPRELTPRMRAVLLAAASGQKVRETALELHVSEQTVRSIRAAACARLHVSNVTAAVYLLGRSELS